MTLVAELFDVLLFGGGYNVTLVMVGAALLGMAAGGVGTFIFLRKRALVSDAVAHATLPGVGLAFIIMVALGGDGRFLPGLLIGSAVSAGIGLLGVEWIARRTRLSQDAAIGAVLSVFFGFGIVLLTFVQTMAGGRQAGLESFLLGSTAGMLFNESLTIAAAGLVAFVVVLMFRRPMTMVAFDPGFAQSIGIDVRRTDIIMMALVMLVTVVGLKIVGLVLIVALLIIPPVTARFWTDRTDKLVMIAAACGGAAGYVGAALSSLEAHLPTGPVIVLVAFTIFLASLLFAPLRGVFAGTLAYWRFQRRVHMRQGLLAIARAEPIFDRMTLATLRRAGLIRADGVPTDAGRGAAAKALHDEARWDMARQMNAAEAVLGRYDGLTAIESLMTRDEISEIDRRIGPPSSVSPSGAPAPTGGVPA